MVCAAEGGPLGAWPKKCQEFSWQLQGSRQQQDPLCRLGLQQALTSPTPLPSRGALSSPAVAGRAGAPRPLTAPAAAGRQQRLRPALPLPLPLPRGVQPVHGMQHGWERARHPSFYTSTPQPAAAALPISLLEPQAKCPSRRPSALQPCSLGSPAPAPLCPPCPVAAPGRTPPSSHS
jgi:hypothetical protein